jgi:hypothetical protein
MDNKKTTCKFCSEEINISETVCPHCDSELEQEDSKEQLELKADAVETDTAEPTETKQPELWNPNAAANWSFLFTVIFGAFLHAKNWKALGNEDNAKKSMYWMYGGIGSIVLYLFLPESAFDYVLIFGPLLGWYFTMAKAQAKYLNDSNIDYKPKSWGKPVGIGMVALVLFFGISAMLVGNSELEESAIPVVNDITKEYYGAGAAKCIDVKIDKELKSGFYKATAYLDNGNTLTIMIQELDNDQIYVTIPEDQ